ncbi:hypothetical protein QM480_01010 [Flectobacillus sp. DC10W]|jgi:hypothetical protein|uniref:Uncharacterized protein n=1 Tax=Flectobacillus longus TaxID=2984207 RepID=A0ABT6YH90_9BACT|nr:hypothetical protein [Flectobacillus longus]MDI9862885.1 hypothetical protein [Flectobacillus longus]
MNRLYTLLFLFISFLSQAQDGVFLTAEDFIENKVYRPEHSKIHERFATVSIKDDGLKTIYSADNAYGYKLKGRQWRFTENRTYEVVSTEGLWVYRVQNATDLSSFSYYFSDGAYGEVKPLTRRNIRNCFSSNSRLLAVIEKLDWRMDLFQPTNFRHLPLISALFVQVFSKNGYPL